MAGATRGRDGETDTIGGWNARPNQRVVKVICDLADHLRPEAGGGPGRLITFVRTGRARPAPCH